MDGQDLLEERKFRNFCVESGGEIAEESHRHPGGFPDLGCRFPSGAILYVDEETTNGQRRPGRAVAHVESHGDVSEQFFDTARTYQERTTLGDSETDEGITFFTR